MTSECCTSEIQKVGYERKESVALMVMELNVMTSPD